MDSDPRISKRIALAFHPKYTLSENQLIKYRTDLGDYDYKEEEIDNSLKYSREKLSNVLSSRGIRESEQIISSSNNSSEQIISPSNNSTEQNNSINLSTISDNDFTLNFLETIEKKNPTIMIEFIKKIGEEFSKIEFNENSYTQLNSLGTIISKTQSILRTDFDILPIDDLYYNKLSVYSNEIFNFKNLNLTIKKEELLNKIKIYIPNKKYDKLSIEKRDRLIQNFRDIIDTIYPKYIELYTDLKGNTNNLLKNELTQFKNSKNVQGLSKSYEKINEEISNSGLSNDIMITIKGISSDLKLLRQQATLIQNQRQEQTQTERQINETVQEINITYPNIDENTKNELLNLNNLINRKDFSNKIELILNKVIRELDNPINSLDYIGNLENLKYLLGESVFLSETKFNKQRDFYHDQLTNSNLDRYSNLKYYIKEIDKQITKIKWNIFTNKYIDPVKRVTIDTGKLLGRGIVSGSIAVYDFFKRGATATGRAAYKVVTATGRAVKSGFNWFSRKLKRNKGGTRKLRKIKFHKM